MAPNLWMRAAALAAALTLAPAAAQAQQAVGIASAVKNDARIRKPGTPLPRPVMLKQRVALNDQVQTGAKSQLQLLLLDKSVFTIGANARMTIDRYVYDPNGGRSVGASVVKGAFRFMSGRPDRGGGSAIRTPVASIGIRGTIVEGVVGESAALIAAGERAIGKVRSDPATATLIVLRGPGRGTQGNTLPGAITVTANGRAVDVTRPMLAVYVPGPGMAPIGPFAISPNALMQIQALLYPSVADRLGLRGPADNLGGDPDSVYYPPTREGPSYPPPGGYRPGPYPPGTLPGAPGNFPAGNNAPPGAGPGFPVPNMPTIPQPGPRQPRPTVNQGPAPNNNPPPTTAPPPNNPPPNNPPPNNPLVGPSPNTAPPPNSLSAAPPGAGPANPNGNPPGAAPNNPNGNPPPKGKTGGTADPVPPPPR